MLIPSIDLKGGAVVQLVQGERLAIRDDDVFRWVRRFETIPEGAGDRPGRRDGASATTSRWSRQIAGALACRVGGGIRTVERARDVLAAGAQQIIAGSSLFKDGAPDLAFAANAARRRRPRPSHRRRGQHAAASVVIHGWKTTLPLTAVDAVRALEPYCDEFLYTHVDTEGLMGGTNLDRDPRGARRDARAGSRPPAASPRSRKSTNCTRSASTPSSAWPSTPEP